MSNQSLKASIVLMCIVDCAFAYAQDTMWPEGKIEIGKPLVSANGSYQLEITEMWGVFNMRRRDGTTRTIFSKDVNFVTMQPDGNLVAYASWGDPMWNTETWGKGSSYLKIYDDGNMVVRQIGRDGDLVTFELGPEPIATAGEPTKIGDVVGRDLNVPLLGGLGHLGVWDGEFIIEAVDGYTNAIRPVSVQPFKTQTKYWGVASATIPEGLLQTSCYESFCSTRKPYSDTVDARIGIAKRTRQVMAIGADYTTTGNVIHADFKDENRPAQRGRYRCDSFVVHMLVWSSNYQVLNPERKLWRERIVGLAYGTSLSPSYVFNTLKTFQ